MFSPKRGLVVLKVNLIEISWNLQGKGGDQKRGDIRPHSGRLPTSPGRQTIPAATDTGEEIRHLLSFNIWLVSFQDVLTRCLLPHHSFLHLFLW